MQSEDSLLRDSERILWAVSRKSVVGSGTVSEITRKQRGFEEPEGLTYPKCDMTVGKL